ncbi:serine/threonine-protein kinase [Shewanella sp. AC91-MNA-CIBAN-0169]|uniref:serine/threonine-protein kinase n=1 Tax=Shewanella sp. AC91-MNA-CIBAN-0169 TaxID=3140466 RepID=UPI00331CB20E
MTKNRSKIVYDSQGNQYELTGKIGEGGQGVVCSTDRVGTLVKIINSKDKAKIDKAIKQIDWIGQQNISDLNMALPQIAIIKPKYGYVMELMDGLIPLETVINDSFNDLQDNGSTQRYLDTGGVARRTKLLFKIAKTLSELHSRGYAYGDLSPANIFVSESVNHSQVWFIDCDNICFNEREGVTHLHTPGYGAPEVVRNEQNVNSLTDAWSFAVMAFELLTHQHPFKGLHVENGEPEIVEQEAYEGKLPWVYDLQDSSNETSGGIPLELVCNQNMAELFRHCFEGGKNNPLLRPSLSQWRTVLQQAVDQTIDCQHCRHQFFYQIDENDQFCPFCYKHAMSDSFIKFEQVLVEQEEGNAHFHPLNNIRILNKDDNIVFNSAPYGTQLWTDATSLLTIEWQEDKLHILPTNNAIVQIHKAKSNIDFTQEKRIPLSNSTPNTPYYFSAWQPSEIEDDAHLKLVQSYRWRFV